MISPNKATYSVDTGKGNIHIWSSEHSQFCQGIQTSVGDTRCIYAILIRVGGSHLDLFGGLWQQEELLLPYSGCPNPVKRVTKGGSSGPKPKSLM